MLDSSAAAANWGEWLDRLGALATRALRQPDRVLAVLAELAPMAPVGPVSLSEVLTVLGPAPGSQRCRPPSQRYGKVFVGPIEAARGLSFDAVFVPGLAEKMFPRKIVEEPILLDAIARADSAAVSPRTRAGSKASVLPWRLRPARAERRICFSYPRLDLDQGTAARAVLLRAGDRCGPPRAGFPTLPSLRAAPRRATTARLGWPAPPDPADAIDDAEHDLAILDRLIARARRERRRSPLSGHRQSVSRPGAPGPLPALEQILDTGRRADEPIGRRSGRSWRGTR